MLRRNLPQSAARHLADERPATPLVTCWPFRRRLAEPAASRQAGATVYLTGRSIDAAAARWPGTIGQLAVHAEHDAAAMSLMSHRLSPPGR
jgi:hypothetical protein